MLKELVHAGAVLRIEGDPDAGLDLERHPMHGEGLRQDCLHAFDESGRLARVHAREQEAELVTSQTGNGLGTAHALAKPCSELVQKPVAEVVPEGVVHVLEAVQVHDQEGEGLLAAAGLLERVLDAVVEEAPVRQAGQAIVQRLVAKGLARRACAR